MHRGGPGARHLSDHAAGRSISPASDKQVSVPVNGIEITAASLDYHKTDRASNAPAEAAGREVLALAAHLRVDDELRHRALLRRHRLDAEPPGSGSAGASADARRPARSMRSSPTPAASSPRSGRSSKRSQRDHMPAARSSDFRVDDEQVSVAFKGPGYMADASIDRRSGKYEFSESRLGPVAIAQRPAQRAGHRRRVEAADRRLGRPTDVHLADSGSCCSTSSTSTGSPASCCCSRAAP